MKRFVFKRQLIILACIITVLCVAIPVATFAKAASGEPHRPLTPSKVTKSTTSTGDFTITATTDADCSSPTIINLTPFSGGDKVTVTASLADVNDPTENTENEPLLVSDTGGVFTQTIPVDTGSQTFPVFTAPAGDTLEACVTGADGDELGTITVSVSPCNPGGKLSQADAAQQLSAAGITSSSTGNCTDRNNSQCTSFEGIRQTTITGIINFAQQSGVAVNITGGTEVGHTAGATSHANGYKLDISDTQPVTDYILNNYTLVGTRKNGDPIYQDSAGNEYVHEVSLNHWDITYKGTASGTTQNCH